MKTVYRFYQKYSDVILDANDDLDIRDKYPLYALTNDKKLAKEFIRERDMDKFILRKSKMDNDEYVSFANQNSSSVLSSYDYVSYDKDDSFKERDIRIVSTWNEKEIVMGVIEESVASMESVKYISFPFMFSEKYYKALDDLCYVSFWKLNGNVSNYMEYMTEEEIESTDDYSFPELRFDEVSVFIYIHGYTMK